MPKPVSVVPNSETFTVAHGVEIHADAVAMEVARYLADVLRAATGFQLPVRAPSGDAGAGSIRLVPGITDVQLGREGYELSATESLLTLSAPAPAGLVRGVQTLRQLLAPGQAGWTVPGGHIRDYPRFPYRGLMLDVARHFFPVPAVRRLIDLAALHKINHLHLHLTDDQGWRIAIDTWPRLASYGGATEVGDGPGGFYAKAEYREIVEYAARHFITVVPEVDIPGHTNAALASYPELTCDGVAPPRYTGVEVGFSSLCVAKDITYRFLDDVFGELAELTPGPYLHIGGDEAKTLGSDEYAVIVERAQEIVAAHGKVPIGWHEIAAAKLLPAALVQYWGTERVAGEVAAASASGNPVIMSPANRTYLDMKYDEASPLGLTWAGHIDVRTAYEWDPVTYVTGVDPSSVIGVEAPLWTETVSEIAAAEYLAFPRLAAIAEVAWSPGAAQDWIDFAERLAGQARLWRSLGIRFFPAPEIGWPD